MLDKFLFIKLHRTLLAQCNANTSLGVQDRKLSERLQSLAFLTPEHLDIDVPPTADGHTGWDAHFRLASEHLQAISVCQCPQDMLTCLRRCVGVLNSLLGGRGSDTLLPLVILTVKTARPKGLMTSLQFMNEWYLYPRKQGERDALPVGLQPPADGSFLHTLVLSACRFLIDCDPVQLSLSPAELKRCMEGCVPPDPPPPSKRSDVVKSLQQPDEEGLVEAVLKGKFNNLPLHGQGRTHRGGDVSVHDIHRARRR